MNTKLIFSMVRERDMDLLFLEAISTDDGFARMIVNRTKWGGSDFSVASVELSRTDAEYGESDITVVIETGGNKYGILIEDKIDAIAMPEQHQRYIERGNKGCKTGEYKDYNIIIICPEKYYDNNDEAQKYEHHIFYEECENYFVAKEDNMSKVRLMQVQSAINKAKKSSETILNEAANDFFKKYRKYWEEHYGYLLLRTSATSNGWWVNYATGFGKAYIYHKMQEGYVDLTFTNADKDSRYFGDVKTIADKLNKYINAKIYAVPTGKSAALRIRVPELKMKEELFENVPEENIIKCFEAIELLTDLSEIFSCAENIKNIRNNKS